MEEKNITLLHSITPEELKESIISSVRAELQLLSTQFQPAQPPEYLTRKEAAALLKVNVITLSLWDKNGILQAYRLGNLIRYKRSELDQALKPIRHAKKN